MKKVLTLAMVIEGEQVLLGMKKRGFGAGRWNGFGGKVDENESVLQAAKRELFEETSLVATDITEVGQLTFTFADSEDELFVHVFRVDGFDGEPSETEEMRPAWFAFDTIPFAQMWSDDEYWFPFLREGKQFRGMFHFDTPATATHSATILRQEIVEIKDCELT